MNELMIGYCKAQGIALLDSVVNFVSGIVDLDENFIFEHIVNNRLFNYYVLVIEKDIENLGDDILVVVHYDYCDVIDELEIERTLNKLLKENKIVKISGGRYTKYKWNN